MKQYFNEHFFLPKLIACVLVQRECFYLTNKFHYLHRFRVELDMM